MTKRIEEIPLEKQAEFRARKCMEHQRYYAKNCEAVIQRSRKYNKEHRKECNEYRRKYRAKKRERQIIYNRVFRSQLPIGSSCAVCGSTNNLERHHWTYDNYASFITLCHSCHKQVHTLGIPLVGLLGQNSEPKKEEKAE